MSGRGGGRRRRQPQRGDRPVPQENGRGRERDNHGLRQDNRPPRPQQATRIQYLVRDDLQRLAQTTSEEVIKCINENEPGFMAAYKHDRNCQHPLFLKYLIKILYHLVKSREEGLASRVVGQILSQEGDFARFLFHLDGLLKNMPLEWRHGIRAENPHVVEHR